MPLSDHDHCRAQLADARESYRPYIEDLGHALFVAKELLRHVESGALKLDVGDDYAVEVAREVVARQEAREAAVLASAAVLNACRDSEDNAEVARGTTDLDDQCEELTRPSTTTSATCTPSGPALGVDVQGDAETARCSRCGTALDVGLRGSASHKVGPSTFCEDCVSRCHESTEVDHACMVCRVS